MHFFKLIVLKCVLAAPVNNHQKIIKIYLVIFFLSIYVFPSQIKPFDCVTPN